MTRAWTPGQATWLQATSGQAWATPGAKDPTDDRGTATLGSLTKSSIGSVTINLNASAASIVQSWVAGSRVNNGFLIAADGAAPPLSIASSEAPSPTNRPRLKIVYSGGSTLELQNGVLPSAAYHGAEDVFIAPTTQSPNLQGNGLHCDGSDSPSNTGSLISFDLSAITPTSKVSAATVRFTVTNKSTESYPLYEALRPWSEATASWDTYDGVNPWELPGADGPQDRGAVELGRFSPDVALRQAVTVPLNAEGVQLVQDWVTGAKENHGLILLAYGLSDGVDMVDSEGAVVAERPSLELTYEEGPPLQPDGPDAGDPVERLPLKGWSCQVGSGGLAGWALPVLALWARRRRQGR